MEYDNSIPVFSDLDRDEILSIIKHPKGRVKKSLIDKWEQFDSLSKSAIRYVFKHFNQIPRFN